MSYITNDSLKKIFGKRVMLIDLETTGVPQRYRGAATTPENEYPDPMNSAKYTGSRIVSIAWKTIDSLDILVDIDKVTQKIIKPIGFEICERSTGLHGISHKRAVEEGISMQELLRGEFGNQILRCDYFVAYNAFFDLNILLSEMARVRFNKGIERLNIMKHEKKIFCLGMYARLMCPPDNWIGSFEYMTPRQKDVYVKLYGEEPKTEHDACEDIVTMYRIMQKIK
jgi:DNA polymerase III epsilon subunit-like protein